MFGYLDGWLNTLLTILVILAGIMIILLIVDLILVSMFRTILSRHNKAMDVILMTKYDNIKKVIAVLQDANIKIDEKIINTLGAIEPITFKEQDTPQCKQAREELTYLRSEIFYLFRKNPTLENNEQFVIAKNNILEMDVVYRNTVAMYNADVLGYNYWVRFLPYRWLFLLFKVKEKEII